MSPIFVTALIAQGRFHKLEEKALLKGRRGGPKEITS